MEIIYKGILNKKSMASLVLGRNKKLVLIHFMNIAMFSFKIRELLQFIKDFLLKDRIICMVEDSEHDNAFDFHFLKLQYNFIVYKPSQFKTNKMQATKSFTNKQVCQKLEQIKQLLESSLQTKSNLSHQSWNQKHAKISDLQTQNKILVYQLKLMLNLMQKLQINENSELYLKNKEDVDEVIAIIEQNKCLNTKLQKMEAHCKNLEKEKQDILDREQQLLRKINLLEKITVDFQKRGGASKINQLKQDIKQRTQKFEKLQKQHGKCRDEIKSLKQRCKILETLNQQTQQKLSEALLKMNGSIKTKIDLCSNKQNTPTNSNTQTKSGKINLNMQLMASKEQIRNLKTKIGLLEKQRQSQKQVHKEREAIYQKMMMKKDKKHIF